MKFKIGMRTFKTGISVFICILISLVLKRETCVVAAITAAIFTLREDMENTMRYGKHRVFGNVLGALTSMIVIVFFYCFGRHKMIQLIIIPVMIMGMISLLASLGFQEGTVCACATLLTIVFMIPEEHSYSYTFARIIDSFIGMGVALAVNYLIPLKKQKPKNKRA